MITLQTFRELRAPIRSLVFLYWIYSFAANAIGAFMQIYLFQLFDSVQLNIIASMLSFTGIMVGFCIYGAAASYARWNAPNGFLWGFMFMTAGVYLLAAAHTQFYAYLAMFIEGLGYGFFWLSIHTFELIETHDDERDRYSTFLSAGSQIISVIGPVFATFLIWISSSLGWGDFTALFVVTPLIFLVSFFFIGSVSEYRPAPIRLHDLIHFITDRRNRASQIYLASDASAYMISSTIMPIVTITILGTALKVGSFNTIFAVVSAIALVLVGSLRNPKRRLLFLGSSCAALAAFSFMLGFSQTFPVFIIYMLGTNIVQPMFRVSEHVIDLQTMDSIGHAQSDFYPTMIFRDLSLWVWRMITGVILLSAISQTATSASSISIGLYIVSGLYAAIFFGASLLLRLQPSVMRSNGIR